jgi:hypothetical protein
MTEYSRQNPSPRYIELLGYYREMHIQGSAELNILPEKMFDGRSMPKHAGTIAKIIADFQAKTILDYGSGKGSQYGPLNLETPRGETYPNMNSFWGVDTITCYDPGYEPFSVLPDGLFDGVVSTDVLEHCPREDISWLLNEIFSYAKKFVYLNIACYPAGKTLPNGENAHCTVEDPQWWIEQLDPVIKRHPEPKFWLAFDVIKEDANGKRGIVTELMECKRAENAPGNHDIPPRIHLT